jgi:hypothetical protein
MRKTRQSPGPSNYLKPMGNKAFIVFANLGPKTATALTCAKFELAKEEPD